MNKTISPSIKAVFVLHSMSATEFETCDIAFPETDQRKKELEAMLPTEPSDCDNVKHITNELFYIDSVCEIATEELNNYGTVVYSINKELWQENKTERFYCIKVNFWLTDHANNYTGEIDTDVNYEYSISDFRLNWEHLDFIQKGSKLYYIDYENRNTSYTVVDIQEVHDDPCMKTGIYYQIHSDQLSAETGYYHISESCIDNDRLFTSEELAHRAFIRFKKRIRKQK